LYFESATFGVIVKCSCQYFACDCRFGSQKMDPDTSLGGFYWAFKAQWCQLVTSRRV